MLVFNKSSQTSVELLVILSIVLVLSALLFLSYFDRVQSVSFEKTLSEAKRVTQDVSFAINTIFLAGPNHSKTIVLPSFLDNQYTYSLDVFNNSVWIFWEDGTYSFPLVTSAVSFTFSQKNIFLVENSDGEVIFS